MFQQVDADETDYDEGWTYYLPAILPRHKVNFLGRYEAWKDGFLQLSGRFVGERDAQKGSTLDAYFVVDAGIEQRFHLEHVDLSIAGYVSNLLGEDYQEQAGYEMPGQVFGLRMSVRF